MLARRSGAERLGLAAILILTAQFFDSVTDSGSDRFLVQDRAGSAPALLRLTHLVSLGRGLLIAVGLVVLAGPIARLSGAPQLAPEIAVRSEEHTSELQSLMRISYAVFCLKKNNTTQIH